MECIVSVIIPAYNSENYISECVNSILKCKDIKLEILVINDGSTDRTASIVQDIAKRDNRVLLYSQKNGGVSAARNKGISLAKGKYIIFSDSDDVLEGENISKLVSRALVEESDVVAFERIDYYKGGKIVKSTPRGKSINTQKHFEYSVQQTILNQNNYGWSSCNKLYKKRIIKENNLRFVDYKTVNSEDRLFNLAYFMHVSKVSFCDECSFHRYVRDNSLSSFKRFENLVERNTNAFRLTCEYLEVLPKEYRFKLLRYYYITFLINVFVLGLKVNKLGVSKTSKEFDRAIKSFNTILEEKRIKESFFKEKGIFTPTSGTKYKILNFLLLNLKMSLIVKILLCIYSKRMR